MAVAGHSCQRKGRLWREIGATVVDPITGANRFLRGDASRVTEKPPEMVPSNLALPGAVGVLWRGTQGNTFSATGQPFLEVDGIYGDPETGHSRTPYDAFAARLRFGGGSALSEARVRGRLLGQPLSEHVEFSVVQSYDFQKNDAYATGSQSFDGDVQLHAQSVVEDPDVGAGLGRPHRARRHRFAPARPDRDPGGGGGVRRRGSGRVRGAALLRLRTWTEFGVTAILPRNNRPFAMFFYEGRHIYSLDGVRANHFLQRGRIDLLLPLRGALGLGVTGEYFDRRTFYQDADRTRVNYHYPQVRTYFTWRLS